MALKPEPRVRPGKPLSFRFSDDTALRLRALVELLGMSQAKILDQLIDREFEEQRKLNAKKVAAAVAAAKTKK